MTQLYTRKTKTTKGKKMHIPPTKSKVWSKL